MLKFKGIIVKNVTQIAPQVESQAVWKRLVSHLH